MDSLSLESRALYEILMANTPEIYESKFAAYKKDRLNAVKQFVANTRMQIKELQPTVDSVPGKVEIKVASVKAALREDLTAVKSALSSEISALAPATVVHASTPTRSTASMCAPSIPAVALDSTPASVHSSSPTPKVSTILQDPTMLSVAPIAVDIKATELSALMPTTCSVECQSHDAPVPLSVLISSAATTSSTTVGNVLSEPAAPVVGYKTLGINASNISTRLRAASKTVVVHDAVDNQAASVPCPSRDASVSLAVLTPLAAPTQSTTTCVDVSGLEEYTEKCSSISRYRSNNDVPTSLPLTTNSTVKLELRPLTWPSFECSQVDTQLWHVPVREKVAMFMIKLMGITYGDDTKAGHVEGSSDLYAIDGYHRVLPTVLRLIIATPIEQDLQSECKTLTRCYSNIPAKALVDKVSVTLLEYVELVLSQINFGMCMTLPTAVAYSAMVPYMHCKGPLDADESDCLASKRVHSWKGALLVGNQWILEPSVWKSFEKKSVLDGSWQVHDFACVVTREQVVQSLADNYSEGFLVAIFIPHNALDMNIGWDNRSMGCNTWMKENAPTQLLEVCSMLIRLIRIHSFTELIVFDHWLIPWDPDNVLVQYYLNRTKARALVLLNDKSVANFASLSVTCELRYSFSLVDNLLAARCWVWCMGCLQLDADRPGKSVFYLGPKPPWSQFAPTISSSKFSSNLMIFSGSMHLSFTYLELNKFGMPAHHGSKYGSFDFEGNLVDRPFIWLLGLYCSCNNRDVTSVVESVPAIKCNSGMFILALRHLENGNYLAAVMVLLTSRLSQSWVLYLPDAMGNCKYSPKTWDPGGYRHQRLEGKPNVKEGGLLATILPLRWAGRVGQYCLAWPRPKTLQILWSTLRACLVLVYLGGLVGIIP